MILNADMATASKRKRPAGAGRRYVAARPSGAAAGPATLTRQMRLMSRSLVSGRKISATTKLIAATMIGYHRPE